MMNDQEGFTGNDLSYPFTLTVFINDIHFAPSLCLLHR